MSRKDMGEGPNQEFGGMRRRRAPCAFRRIRTASPVNPGLINSRKPFTPTVRPPSPSARQLMWLERCWPNSEPPKPVTAWTSPRPRMRAPVRSNRASPPCVSVAAYRKVRHCRVRVGVRLGRFTKPAASFLPRPQSPVQPCRSAPTAGGHSEPTPRPCFPQVNDGSRGD